MDPLRDLQAGAVHITLHSILDQVSEAITATLVVMTTDRDTTETTIETECANKTLDTTREIKTTRTGMTTIRTDTGLTTEDDQIKHQYHRNQPKAQITFEYTNQNLLEMMQTVRDFINFMKANPSDREQYETNKIIKRREYGNEVNESDIHSSNLDQLQQLVNEDTDLVFDALVAADYINEIECTDGSNNQNA